MKNLLKFQAILDKNTNGQNYDLDTEDIIVHLKKWDEQYGIEISEVEFDRVLVTFKNLPENVIDLASDIYEFCPDVVDQGYGCWDECIEELPEDMAQLAKGVDFDNEDFGVEILARDLELRKTVGLWWD